MKWSQQCPWTKNEKYFWPFDACEKFISIAQKHNNFRMLNAVQSNLSYRFLFIVLVTPPPDTDRLFFPLVMLMLKMKLIPNKNSDDPFCYRKLGGGDVRPRGPLSPQSCTDEGCSLLLQICKYTANFSQKRGNSHFKPPRTTSSSFQ